MQKEETLDYHLKSVWHKLSRMYNGIAAKHDVTMAIGHLLLSIPKEGIPSTQLGPALGMEPTSLSRSIASLERQGLITKVGDPNDKRRVRLFLTDKGVEARKQARDIVYTFNEKVTQTLDQEEHKILLSSLAKVQGLLDEELEKLRD